MKTKVSHSLLLLLAAAPFVLAQVPATDPSLPAPPGSAAIPGVAEVLPPPGVSDPNVLPTAERAVPVPDAADPDSSSGLPVPGSPSAPPATRSSGNLRNSTGSPPSATPAPAPVPGLTPSPNVPPPAPPPLLDVPVPGTPAPPRVVLTGPTPVPGLPPNVYIADDFNSPGVAAGEPAHPDPMTANVYSPAPRGEQVIRDIKLKVLQRHYESTLSEAVEAEKAALFAAGGEREALAAKAKALQGFAAKLEADIRALPEARVAVHADARQNTIHMYSAPAGGGGPPVGQPRTSIPRGGNFTMPAPAPALRIEALPTPGSGYAPASGSADDRGRKRSGPARSGGGAAGLPEPSPVPAQ